MVPEPVGGLQLEVLALRIQLNLQLVTETGRTGKITFNDIGLFNVLREEFLFESIYWVTQKLPQICTVILRICIGKVA